MTPDLSLYHRKAPSIAVLTLAGVPFIGLVGLGIAAFGAPLRPGALGSLVVLSGAAVMAMAPMVGRLRRAFLGPVVAGLFGWVASGLIARLSIPEGVSAREWAAMAGSGGTGGLILLFFIAAALGFWRGDAYRVPWDPPPIQAAVVAGLRAFLKDSPGALWRALAAIPLLVLAFLIVGLLLPVASEDGMTTGTLLGPSIIVTLVSAGIGLLASSLRVPDDEVIDPEGDLVDPKADPPQPQ